MNPDYIDYTVYGTATCYECKEAMKLLERKGLPVNYIDAPSSTFFQDTFVKQGVRKVPQIYVANGTNYRHIGGYEDLIKELL